MLHEGLLGIVSMHDLLTELAWITCTTWDVFGVGLELGVDYNIIVAIFEDNPKNILKVSKTMLFLWYDQQKCSQEDLLLKLYNAYKQCGKLGSFVQVLDKQCIPRPCA